MDGVKFAVSQKSPRIPIMKTILVPTDFSECSLNALEFAAHFAGKTNAEIRLVHVLEVPGTGNEYIATGEYRTSSDVPFMVSLLKAVRKRMAELMREPFLKKVKVTDSIETGSVAEKIAKASKKYKADIIFMGSHGTSGYNNFFIGSNAEKVARLAEIPLLTIKHRIDSRISKIAFATDFSDEAIRVFPFIRKFAGYFNAEIYLVKVITPSDFKTQRENRDVVKSFLETHDQKEYPVTLYNDKKKEAGIIHFADDIQAGIIAIGTHGKGSLSRFFSGSVSEDLVEHAFLPVLTVNFTNTGNPPRMTYGRIERKRTSGITEKTREVHRIVKHPG